MQPLAAIEAVDVARTPTGQGELDRVLGGGIVEGGVVLIGGDPGIGKSTLLLQAMDALQRAGLPTLYVTGEESGAQVAMRARRLGLERSQVQVMAEIVLQQFARVHMIAAGNPAEPGGQGFAFPGGRMQRPTRCRLHISSRSNCRRRSLGPV
mgnify:CR=1 FL=1